MMTGSYFLIRGGYQGLTYIMFDHMRTVNAEKSHQGLKTGWIRNEHAGGEDNDIRIPGIGKVNNNTYGQHIFQQN